MRILVAGIGPHEVSSAPDPRPFDIPWIVLENRLAGASGGWSPTTPREAIFEEIAAHAAAHPDWLELTNA
jgi:CDP-paratose 2-epimerase